MPKQYKGSLTLDWYNKQKAIVTLDAETGIQGSTDLPAPAINWINKDEALYFEISPEAGKGFRPYWVDRNDIRVKEARPFTFQKAFRAIPKNKEGTLAGMDTTWEVETILNESETHDIENILIQGDNLLALNTLKKRFQKLSEAEQIKCIYIDPPYNIGTAFEQYDDNLEHSEWLTLTRDRLVILRDLLAEDGSIWISIDDKEMAYLRVLMDEIFGRDKFIACNVWQKRYSRENREAIGDVHEYILVYAKNPELFKVLRNKLPLTDNQKEVYRNSDNDADGPWRALPMTAQGRRPNQMYPITAPGGKVHYPPEGRCWSLIEENFKKLLDAGRIYFGKDNNSQPGVIRFLSEVPGIVPWTWWPNEEVGHTDEAKKEMHTIFGRDQAFETPKPERLIERILHIATDPGELVLDCFGGSGTTYAVAQKMQRKWIGIEVGAHADTHIIKRLIGTISGSVKVGVDEKHNWQGGGSFKYYHIGPSIIRIDEETGKGEFNWSLGKRFLQDALLLSYDFTPTSDQSVLPPQLFQTPEDTPSVGYIEGPGGKTLYGMANLAKPSDANLSITNEEVKAIYASIKNRPGFQALVIYTNKGVDLAEEAIPSDLEIIKVPNAVFTELEN